MIWPPQAGYFRMRLARNAWAVPCRIAHDWSGWYAVFDSVPYPPHEDPAHAPWVPEIWAGGEFITVAEYNWLIGIRMWAAQYHPAHPALHPWQAIDRLTVQPRLPPKPKDPDHDDLYND
jgi:hypothetical protein